MTLFQIIHKAYITITAFNVINCWTSRRIGL